MNLGLLGTGDGRLVSLGDRHKAHQILVERIAAGAGASELAKLIGVRLSTLLRWRRKFQAVGDMEPGMKI